MSGFFLVRNIYNFSVGIRSMVYGVFLILPLRLFPFFPFFPLFSFFVLVLFCSCFFCFFVPLPWGFPLPFPLLYCGLLEFFGVSVWGFWFLLCSVLFLFFLGFVSCVCCVSSLSCLCVFCCVCCRGRVVFFFFEKTTPSVRWSSVFGVFAVVLTFS